MTIRKLLLFIFLFYCYSSCRKLVQEDFAPFPMNPVINSIIIADSILVTHLSFTNTIDLTSISGYDSASIRLLKNNQFQEYLSLSGDGLYRSTQIIEHGHSYSIEVTIPGVNAVNTQDKIPLSPVILNLKHNTLAGRDDEGWGYSSLTLTFEEDRTEDNYYQIVIREGGRLEESLPITDPVLSNEGLPIYLFSDQKIDSENYSITFNYRNNQNIGSNDWGTTLDPVILEFRAVSYNYYQYTKQLYLYEQGRYTTDIGGNPPVFNLYSNINNGYGIFAGFASTLSDTIFPEPIE